MLPRVSKGALRLRPPWRSLQASKPPATSAKCARMQVRRRQSWATRFARAGGHQARRTTPCLWGHAGRAPAARLGACPCVEHALQRAAHRRIRGPLPGEFVALRIAAVSIIAVSDVRRETGGSWCLDEIAIAITPARSTLQQRAGRSLAAELGQCLARCIGSAGRPVRAARRRR
jgi:hypothetical protein